MDRADALLDVRVAQEALVASSINRDAAVLNALRAGAALREVAQIAGISPEAIRRIARALSVSFLLGAATYEVTDHQADVFIYKLAGFDAGRFPGDVELLKAGVDWLSAAGDLARAIQRMRTGEEEGPLELDGKHEDWGFALYQVLRLSYKERPSDVSRLYDALQARYRQARPVRGL